jgi:hypothetical protein
VNTPRRTTPRYVTALLLTVIYLFIALSPLAPLALGNSRLAHAMTGECSGDCDVCGCSPEQRANHTCCCQQKLKLQKQHQDSLAECCKNKDRGTTTVLRCSCPCGTGKALALLNLPNSETLPFVFDSRLGFGENSVAYLDIPRRLPTRYGEPPKPPPRFSFTS